MATNSTPTETTTITLVPQLILFSCEGFIEDEERIQIHSNMADFTQFRPNPNV